MTDNLIKLNFDTDVEERLSEALKIANELQGVIIIGMFKEGGQYLCSSKMTGMEKSFLVQFANSWINSLFDFKNTFEEEK